MGWKANGYYYRTGGKYAGKGEIAEIAAAIDAAGREVALAERALRDRARELARESYARLRLVAARADRLLAEGMELAGYHRHARGSWRRRKMGDTALYVGLDAPAQLARITQDLGSLVEAAKIEYSAGDPEHGELLAAELVGLRRALLAECDSPVLRLAAEQVSHAYLDSQVIELQAAARPQGDPIILEQRRTFAARRYESAMVAFARIRRLEARTLRTLGARRKPA